MESFGSETIRQAQFNILPNAALNRVIMLAFYFFFRLGLVMKLTLK